MEMLTEVKYVLCLTGMLSVSFVVLVFFARVEGAGILYFPVLGALFLER